MANILAITYWSYKEPVFQGGALPYLKCMADVLSPDDTIFLITLEKPDLAVNHAEEEEIRKQLKNYKIKWIKKSYHPFGLWALLAWFGNIIHLLWLCLTGKISYIHCFATPAGSIGWLLSVFTGRSLVIDCYEPHAEAMIENGTWTRNGLAFKLQFRLEKLQSKKAYAIIAHTLSIQKYTKEKFGFELKNLFIRANHVDLALFDASRSDSFRLKKELGVGPDDIVCVYAGKIGGIYLEKELFDFFAAARKFWGRKFKALLLSDIHLSRLQQFIVQSGLVPENILCTFASHDRMPEYLSVASFAICAVKPIPTKKYCCPIKTGEYWAMGLPVVIPANIGDDSSIVEQEDIGAVLHTLDQNEYDRALRKIDSIIHSDNFGETRKKIVKVAQKYRGAESIRKIYNELYGSKRVNA